MEWEGESEASSGTSSQTGVGRQTPSLKGGEGVWA